MAWMLEFYPGVEQQILTLPPGLQARVIRLLELMQHHGADLGPPHTDALGHGLFELRAKAQEGIARGLFCYKRGNHIVLLHVFVKKSQKTPRQALRLALQRMNEVKT